MKLGSINTDEVLNKYSISKAGLSKDLSTGDPDKTELGDRSGNQDTPVPKKAQDLLGAKDLSSQEPDLVNKI